MKFVFQKRVFCDQAYAGGGGTHLGKFGEMCFFSPSRPLGEAFTAWCPGAKSASSYLLGFHTEPWVGSWKCYSFYMWFDNVVLENVFFFVFLMWPPSVVILCFSITCCSSSNVKTRCEGCVSKQCFVLLQTCLHTHTRTTSRERLLRLLGYNKLELLIYLNAVERESLQNLRFSHDFVSFTWWYAGVTK